MSKKNVYDCIVVGGGHNGLVNAAYLARSGRKVLVLEKRHLVGGAAVSEEIYPGFTYSVCSYVVSLLRPQIIRDLELARHGLEVLPMDCSFTPMLDGNYLARWSDAEKTRREIARHSKRDAEVYGEFSKEMVKISKFVKPILEMTPPRANEIHLSEMKDMHGMKTRFQGLGADQKTQLLKIMTMSASEYLDQWFETEVLKATMAVSGIIGTFLGVKSPSTAYVLLHHYMGEIDGAFRSWGLVKGGMGTVSNSIAAAAREHGAEIRTSTPVDQFIIKKGEAVGVALENGDEIYAKVISSGLDPYRTFIGLAEPEHFDDSFLDQVKRYKFRGSSGKVNLALDACPDFTCFPGQGMHLQGDIAIAPSMDYLETAYDEAKYGDFSKRPYLNIVIPSLSDPTVAPPGKHVMSIFVQYAPYFLKEGTWPEKREAFGDAVIDTLAQYAPNIKDIILHRQVLTPWDIEQEFGMTQGNIFHGELSLEQLFFLRPVPGWAQYRTPIKNLYLCSSGAHPGGGVMGAPGYNAAQMILKDWKGK